MTKHLYAFKIPEEILMIIEAIGLYSPNLQTRLLLIKKNYFKTILSQNISTA